MMLSSIHCMPSTWPCVLTQIHRMDQKIVVIGGSGLIGSRVVKSLVASGRNAVAASPRTGVNAQTGEQSFFKWTA